jgi:hypothetical protein
MREYQVSGYLMIEGTDQSADYDFILEWDEFREPTEMDILNDMIQTGLIQVINQECEEL